MLTRLKKWMPWHLRKSLVQFRRFYGMRKPPFEGVYESFHAVTSGNDWSSEAWTQSSLRTAERARGEIGHLIPDVQSVVPLLIGAYHASRPTLPVRILDFGGGAGQGYAHLKATLSADIALTYTVVETPECCDAGRVMWQDDASIIFRSELPAEGESFDVVLASSSLFYVEDFKGLLGRLASYRPSLLFVGKTPAHAGPSFIRAQTNLGSPSRLPHWVLGIEELTETMRGFGYTLSYRAFDGNFYNADNYPEAFRVERTSQFLFVPVAKPPCSE